MKLYSYYRSSASYRVRIALHLKGLEADIIPVNLLKHEQKSDSHAAINPEKRVPVLVDGEHVFTQSLAIMEYLEERYPHVSLLPVAPPERARVRALAQAIACDISPLANLGPLHYLTQQLHISEEQKLEWIRYWIAGGFSALEAQLSAAGTARFCHGATPTLADCCLVPQVYNARRFGVDLAPFPIIAQIDAMCNELPAFIAAHPDQQVDKPPV